MKYLLYIFASLAILVSCGNGQSGKSAVKSETVTAYSDCKNDRVELLAFFGAQRCATCRAIEAQSEELVESSFADEIADGTLVYRKVDITTPDGESLADSYEVASSSLLLVQFRDGKLSVQNLTRFAFSTARNKPEVFKEELSKIIRDLLGDRNR